MKPPPVTSFITASALALALLGMAGCDDNSGAQVEQSDTIPGTTNTAPAADDPNPSVPPAD